MAKGNTVSRQKYVETYMEVYNAGNGTYAKLADKLGQTVGTVTVRASTLRKAGINLPKFTKETGTDVDGLNALITSKLTPPPAATDEVVPPAGEAPADVEAEGELAAV